LQGVGDGEIAEFGRIAQDLVRKTLSLHIIHGQQAFLKKGE
jgi:hypothetical protein